MIWYHRPYKFNTTPLWTIGQDQSPSHGLVQITPERLTNADFVLKIWGPHGFKVEGFSKYSDNWIRVIS